MPARRSTVLTLLAKLEIKENIKKKELTGAIWGLESRGPITGIDLRNDTMTPKKSPNRAKIPKHSIRNPMMGCLNRISPIPSRKQIVPFAFCGRAKK